MDDRSKIESRHQSFEVFSGKVMDYAKGGVSKAESFPGLKVRANQCLSDVNQIIRMCKHGQTMMKSHKLVMKHVSQYPKTESFPVFFM